MSTRAAPSPAHALITGAAGGIGRALAERFAADGFAVGLIDLDGAAAKAVAEAVRARGHVATVAVGDVTDEASIAAAVTTTTAALEERSGPAATRTLITNAGVMSRVPLLQLDAEELDRCYRVNVAGTLLSFRAAYPWLAGASQASVVTLSSGAGLNPASVTGPAYRLAKAGIISLTRILAAELKHEGIRVNCVAPGGVDGGMSVAFSSDELRGMRAAALGQRLATLEEVAAAASFAASVDASFVTGSVIPVTGGVVF